MLKCVFNKRGKQISLDHVGKYMEKVEVRSGAGAVTSDIVIIIHSREKQACGTG